MVSCNYCNACLHAVQQAPLQAGRCCERASSAAAPWAHPVVMTRRWRKWTSAPTRPADALLQTAPLDARRCAMAVPIAAGGRRGLWAFRLMGRPAQARCARQGYQCRPVLLSCASCASGVESKRLIRALMGQRKQGCARFKTSRCTCWAAAGCCKEVARVCCCDQPLRAAAGLLVARPCAS